MIDRGRKWTTEETETLLSLRAQSVTFPDIAVRLSRTRKAVEWRYQLVRLTPEKKEKFRERKNASSRTYRKRPHKINPLRFVPGTTRIPEDVLMERDVRLAAPRTITAHFMGDPPIGYSALDKREVRA